MTHTEVHARSFHTQSQRGAGGTGRLGISQDIHRESVDGELDMRGQPKQAFAH